MCSPLYVGGQSDAGEDRVTVSDAHPTGLFFELTTNGVRSPDRRLEEQRAIYQITRIHIDSISNMR